jgi:Na+-transporting methylmalonyl-CoA/oxaloacetate decarboxylase gamma subunit
MRGKVKWILTMLVYASAFASAFVSDFVHAEVVVDAVVVLDVEVVHAAEEAVQDVRAVPVAVKMYM